MASGTHHVPVAPNTTRVAVVSEANPVLRQSPILQEFVDESVFSSPASSLTLLSDTTYDEQAPLLGKPPRERSKPWYRQAAPKLLVPFALASALCRGMTLAPRVEVFTQIACDELRIEPDRAYELASFYNYSSHHDFPVHLGLQIPILEAITSQPRTPGRVHSSTVVYVGNDDNHSHSISFTPLSSDPCRVDPEVQQGAARLQTLIMTLSGALSALTSGFWGQFGDKHGRTGVIALTIFAMLATDCIFLLAASQSANPTYSFLSASRLLVISPLFEGLLGGFPTMQAAFNAYISDATPAGTSRAKIFARFFGIIFVGVAIGPTLSSLLPFNPFRSSITLGVLNLILVLLFLPESLTKEQRTALAASRVSLASEVQKPENQGLIRRIIGYVTGTVRGTFEPMAILLPKKRKSQGQAVSGNDWNLTYLAIALSIYLLTIAIYSVKFLYAQHAFGWGGEELSYYISYMGAFRALNLIVILPYLIKVYKPKSPKHTRPSIDHAYTSPAVSPHGSVTVLNTPITPIRTTSLPAIPTISPSPPPSPGTKTPPAGGLSAANAELIKRSVHHSREQQFDLLVARLSMVMDFWSYFLLCFSNSATGFVLTTTLSAFGGGTSPALQSLALGILGGEEKDVGRLFGALSMLSSISSTILSPIIFGSLYSLTVATSPKVIFIVATAVLTTALVFLALVQPSRPLRRRDVEEFPPRGRSRRAKDLRRMSTYSG
ncbi:putative membrane protein C14C4,07 OS=Schizosaccharomyces pombe (strain 972 / ATCC 24843) GN=SPAC14C4.07 PE=1 SV=1 [Rhizoctonia solani AG-1 IB]|uniref:Putative membrane protein C14C4,07 n=1 Tax=Thanatephorus cucumeris (strain AG1-IB / isolate 7/3/14) TaxID=1108050 RepID=A0A0B7FG02_THACB|nr:putative membrane protein C14C4,07 OS=Schizosaccharomyces pombe (strain 972 / ATCC 24843) GN=SPAC14C4.07 PE=1 SV=1 [Rhizoctonia solani AG-1 IB]